MNQDYPPPKPFEYSYKYDDPMHLSFRLKELQTMLSGESEMFQHNLPLVLAEYVTISLILMKNELVKSIDRGLEEKYKCKCQKIKELLENENDNKSTTQMGYICLACEKTCPDLSRKYEKYWHDSNCEIHNT